MRSQMSVVAYNAAMHAASVLGQPDRALELLEEVKVRGETTLRAIESARSLLQDDFLSKVRYPLGFQDSAQLFASHCCS